MSTPAGWYNDGSGQQRWWDGTRWTEHLAAREPAPVPAAVPEAHMRFEPPYAAPPRPTSPSPFGSPDLAASFSVPPIAQPVAAQRVSRPSALGLAGLVLAALGLTLAFIGPFATASWTLLAVGLVGALASLLRPGSRWPGVTGILLATAGAIVAFFVAYLAPTSDSAGLDDDQNPLIAPWEIRTRGPEDVSTSPPSDIETMGWDEIEVGDCWRYDEADWETGYVDVVPCALPHSDQIYFEYVLPESAFPGHKSLTKDASTACLAEFESFVGETYERSELDFWTITPTEAGWNAYDDRSVQCSIYDPQSTDITGTLQGANR
jgi:hypothetical protein